MKKTALGLAALAAVGIGSAANAADLPVKARAYTPAPAFSWTGLYAGLNLGGGWAHASANVAGVGSASETLSGVVGGGQVGYNWQTGFAVWGIEADIQGTDQHRTTTLGVLSETDRVSYFGTVRGRLGYAVNTWMLYATGGLAYGEFTADFTGPGGSASLSKTHTGWTVGGGAEWAFAPKWSAKVEYLYLDTGSSNGAVFGTPVTTKFTDNIVRAGVNYHF